jgi:large subunit ribosomal protein L21
MEGVRWMWAPANASAWRGKSLILHALTRKSLFGIIRAFQQRAAPSDMYAVITTGGKQYRVSAGEKLKVAQIAADVGSEIVLDQVLMVADGDKITLGAPLLSGATVKAKVVGHGRSEKVRIFKMRRRKHYRKSQGHRQNYTEIEILGIAGQEI